jgi:hypothetical protein
MKKIIFFLLMIVPVVGFTQSKSEIKANKIKSRTTERTEQKDGVTVTYKEFYEEYDKNGNTVLKQEFNKSGELKSKETCKYDSFGNLTEKTDYEKKSGKTVKTVYKYDSKGEKTEETETDSEGNILSRQVYTSDNKGMRKEAKEYNSKGELRWVKKYAYTSF